MGIPEDRADEAHRVHPELSDKDGRKADPVSHDLPPDFPQDMRSTVTFKALGKGRMEMIVTEYGYASDQMPDISKAGLEQVHDKIAESPKRREHEAANSFEAQ